jgi:hypothetical protein
MTNARFVHGKSILGTAAETIGFATMVVAGTDS